MRRETSVLAVVRISFAVDGQHSDLTHTYSTRRIRAGDAAADLSAVIRGAYTAAGLSPTAVFATVPGFLDRDFGTVLHAKNVPELDGHRLANASLLRETDFAQMMSDHAPFVASDCGLAGRTGIDRTGVGGRG